MSRPGSHLPSPRAASFLPSTHATSYPHISPLSFDLKGRSVVITGAALEDGIGYATATAYARAGASCIVILDVHQISNALITRLEDAARTAGRRTPMILSCLADISDLGAVESIKEKVSETCNGRLDVLVNNAAVQEPYRKLLDADPDVYWRTWEVNVRGLFNTTRVFLPMLLASHKQHSGLCTIVNVASSGALSVRPGGASYRTSKLAILRWTEALQLEYGDEGLLTFCANPGAIKTSITVNEPEELRNRLPHEPQMAGDTLAWLSAQRWGWLAGRYVSCPWDMEALEKEKERIAEEDLLKVKLVV